MIQKLTCASFSWCLLFQEKMQAVLLLGCFVLVATEFFRCSGHMIPDDRLSTNRVVLSNALSQSVDAGSPPVVIVGKLAG